VANVHEFGAIKDLVVALTLDIGTHEATHPVIGDNN
jgi:hypothetical protein